jgi:hypothetical protein
MYFLGFRDLSEIISEIVKKLVKFELILIYNNFFIKVKHNPLIDVFEDN